MRKRGYICLYLHKTAKMALKLTGKVRICPTNGLNLASKPSKGSLMGQRTLELDSNQSGAVGVHFEPVILIWTFPKVDGGRWWWQWLIRIADSGVSDSQLTEQTWDLSRVEGALTASGRRPLLLSIRKTNRVQKKINFTRVMMADEDS